MPVLNEKSLTSQRSTRKITVHHSHVVPGTKPIIKKLQSIGVDLRLYFDSVAQLSFDDILIFELRWIILVLANSASKQELPFNVVNVSINTIKWVPNLLIFAKKWELCSSFLIIDFYFFLFTILTINFLKYHIFSINTYGNQ